MSSTTLSPEVKKTISSEVLFMNSLENILGAKEFTAQVYPEGEKSIRKARVYLDEALITEDFMKVIKLANEWNTTIKISPSGKGIRLLFQSK